MTQYYGCLKCVADMELAAMRSVRDKLKLSGISCNENNIQDDGMRQMTTQHTRYFNILYPRKKYFFKKTEKALQRFLS